MSDMIQRYEEEAEAFYQATGVMAPGKDAAAAMHGYDADELRHKLWRMWARAVYAERERDEVRQRADRAERILAALREPSEGVVEDAASKMHDVSEPDGDCRIAWEDCIPWYHITRRKMTTAAIRAAVAAAEQEVG